MHVATDTDACIASGQCAMAVPEVFDQAEETGTVRLLMPVPPAALGPAVRAAASSCPVGAITVTEQ